MRDDAVDALVAVRDELRASEPGGRRGLTGHGFVTDRDRGGNRARRPARDPEALDSARARVLGRARGGARPHRTRPPFPRARWAGACPPFRGCPARPEARCLAAGGARADGPRARARERGCGSRPPRAFCRSCGRAAAARIAARHGFDLERQPELARALLGEDVWELLRPDRPEPADRFGPGVPHDQIAAVIARVEAG